MNVWSFIKQKLEKDINVMLLLVVESIGSSPGRAGFEMAVSGDGEITGTIGGGIMEHKLVEKAKMLLTTEVSKIELMRQYHDKEHTLRSGMICSGSQVIAFVPLSRPHLSLISPIIGNENKDKKNIQLTPRGLQITDAFQAEKNEASFQYINEEDWIYQHTIDARPVVHIIGAGHVGFALSQQLSLLDFYIHIYDDRPGLNMLVTNNFAHQKHVVEYETIGEQMAVDATDYIVIVTVGYKTDKIVFKQLLGKEIYYLGLMGSDAKIKTLLAELEKEGMDPTRWKHCFTPIGLAIHSRTAAEIAVSIAAEMIREKNKNLPTGRTPFERK